MAEADAPNAHGEEEEDPHTHGEGAVNVAPDDDPTDDEGPSGPPPDQGLPPGAKRKRVDFKAVTNGENLAKREVIIARQTKFLAAPASGEPKMEHILARTTHNLDT
eukprot:3063822-Pyramimonas_sp.AAC.1